MVRGARASSARAAAALTACSEGRVATQEEICEVCGGDVQLELAELPAKAEDAEVRAGGPSLLYLVTEPDQDAEASHAAVDRSAEA